ncbi:glucokinase [Primorskyibacter sp. S87]|uniref:glucokinase n=1 Tax=Primorskyibacter sp. S87 TaxID=3415126 RepID=UPI003C7D3C65
MKQIRLVADVGGTNSRIGLAGNGVLIAATVRSYRNDDHADFFSVADAFLSETGPLTIDEIAVAVAGPVSEGTARLTNRDWRFDETALSSRLKADRVCLLNDLNALGYATPFLDPGRLDTVFMTDAPHRASGQALIVGIGTGFNVSPVVNTAGQVRCLNAELGHAPLPSDIAEILTDQFGAAAADFRTVEEVFSGRGYAALSGLHGDTSVAGNTTDKGFQSFYTKLLGTLARSLMLTFLPSSGIFFAGGVARSLLDTPARDRFVDVYSLPFDLNNLQPAPVFLIRDDAAALLGCAKYPMGS